MKTPIVFLDQPRELTEASRKVADVMPAFWRWRMQDISTSTAHGLEIVDYVAELKENLKAGRGLILWGSNFTRKTSMACTILKEAMSLGAHSLVLWMSQFRSVVLDKRMAYGGDRSILAKAHDVHLLMIDDVKGFSLPSLVEEFEELIRHRVGNGLSTILTTNLNPMDGGLAAVIGQGTYLQLESVSKPVPVI